MKILLTATTAGALLLTGDSLSTDYTKERTLKVEFTTKLSSEVTAFSMTIDGEEREGRGGGGAGGTTEIERTVEFKDTVLAHDDGRPTKVKREFTEIGGTSMTLAGEQEFERELESALEGVTLELSMGEDGVEADVIDGDEPADEQLSGHLMTLSLDALLPEGEVDGGDEWDIEGDAIAIALGLSIERVLFMRPERDGEGGGERPERGGGGGRRWRGGGGGGGGLNGALLAGADWEGTATLSDGLVEHDGVKCFEIELELEASGELPEPERQGRGRDRAFGLNTSGAAPFETTLQLELEGRLLFDAESGHPVLLELEGDYTLDSETEREFGERTMNMSRTTEGTLSYLIEVTED